MTLRRIAVLCALFFAALPAAAHAAPSWNRVADPAPGATEEFYDGTPPWDLAVAGGTPYLASESVAGKYTRNTQQHLTVWRPDHGGGKWIQVGPRLNHDPLRYEW